MNFRIKHSLFVLLFIILTTCSKDESSQQKPQFNLNLQVNPIKGGTIAHDSGTFEGGTEIFLRATPSEGYVFKKWTGGITGTENPINFFIDKDLDISAEFQLDQNSENFTLSENTYIIDERIMDDYFVSLDTIDFTFAFKEDISDILFLKPNDILIGTKEAGFLRKIKKITKSNNQVILETDFVTIIEAFERLNQQTQLSLVPNLDGDEFWLDEGITISSGKTSGKNNNRILNFTISKVLFDADGDNTSVNDQLRISGDYSLTPTFGADIQLNGNNFEKIEFDVIYNNQLSLTAHVGGTIENSVEKKIGKIPFGYVTVGPVIVEPIIEFYAGVNVELNGSIQFGSSQDYRVYTKITTQNGNNWQTEKSIIKNTEFFEPLVNLDAEAKVYFKPVLKFRIYKVLSPYVDAEIYGKAKVEYPSPFKYLNLQGYNGFNFGFGVKMGIFKKTLFDYHFDAYSEEDLILDKQIQLFSDIVFNPNLTYGTLNDIDGNTYRTIKIGDQTWMAQNLKTTKYNNGDEIPYLVDNNSWVNTQSGAYSKYDKRVYGNYYNRYVVTDERNVCPENWHIPTKIEWDRMINFLGGRYEAGSELRETGTNHWSTNDNSTNSSGFTALPVGLRSSDRNRGTHHEYDGQFLNQGEGGQDKLGSWWTGSAKNSSDYFTKSLFMEHPSIEDNIFDSTNSDPNEGYCIRCVKDDENGSNDSDNDGVANSNDFCPETPEGENVDDRGCSSSQYPQLVSLQPSQITDNSVLLKGQVVINSSYPVKLLGWQIAAVESGASLKHELYYDEYKTGTISKTITGLKPNTEYWYRVFAYDNYNEDFYGGDIYFTTTNNGNTGTDSDGDGVRDDIDQCPNTQSETTVDSNGCPITWDDDGDGLSNEINDLIPKYILDEMINLGMPIHTGNNPPNIENSYLSSPNILFSSNISNDLIGRPMSDSRIKFYSQDNSNLTVQVTNEEEGTLTTGLGSFIAGNNNKFTVFAETSSTDVDTGDMAKTVLVYSGTLTTGGIADLHTSYFMIDNNGNPNGKFIENGEGRVIKDSDGFSEFIEAFSKFINVKKTNSFKSGFAN
ncbi:FISUMP domain-containing protein [Tamlana sp. 2201CG12-4]|uniref:FISUMP domain-containing protein n=1 Tax=Tamlana sp. 2201CG12-4 TaxID=3112582 RepID=UPI002DBA5076|nr:FISUMP domain-containing protein [Tamlana sp. 2201CG12-4]MEC3908741.1 FISUMP domain-containing protein [Tamlana sp. 2201CG12-4]